jgi:hypothetical protein
MLLTLLTIPLNRLWACRTGSASSNCRGFPDVSTTATHRLVFGGSSGPLPTGVSIPWHGEFSCLIYGDSDWATCQETRGSVSGVLITINGTAVVFYTRGQTIVSKTTMAAGYIAKSTASDDGMLLHKLIDDLRIAVRPIPLLCDNVTTTKVSPNPVENTKMKYHDIHFHVVRERIASGHFKVHGLSTNTQLADSLTKPLLGPEVAAQRVRMGMLRKTG